MISRRLFLESTATALTAAAAGAPEMPTRILGKTGVRVSLLAFGAGSRFLGLKRDAACAMLNHALDLGINYIDTCESYGNGESETRIGQVLRTRRTGVFLATKLDQRDYSGAMRAMERSLNRLGTGQVDLVHIHSLTGPEDLAKIGAKGGVYEALLKMRDQKLTRFLGVTSHNNPSVLKEALERHDFDCTQMALNAAQRDGGRTGNMYGSFETIALPVAVRKNMGIVAMKAFAQDEISHDAPAAQLISYCLTLPVAALVVGMPKLAMLEENVQLARSFRPLSAEQMDRLGDSLSRKKKASLDQFFQGHVDC